MTSDRYLAERIPWYLNGTLDPAETAEVERLLAASPEARDELAEARLAAAIYGHRLPAEVLVSYAFDGSHRDVPGDLLERYVAVSPVAAQELRWVRESLAALEAEAAVPRPRALGEPVPGPATGWRRLALAASLLGVLGLGLAAWQWGRLETREARLAEVEQQLREALAQEAPPAESGSRLEALEAENLELAAGKSDLVEEVERQQERIRALDERIADLSEPLLNLPVLDVFPDDMTLRGEGEGERPVVIPAQTRSATLILNSRTGSDQEVAGLRIVDAQGAIRWQSDDRPQRDEFGVFTVGIPVQSLGAGSFTLQLVAPAGGGVQVVESYEIEIR